MSLVNIAEWIDCTEVEGPGKRFALWVQGCELKCPECCNPHMLEFSPKNLLNTEQVLSLIESAKAKDGIEGVTFLGGEPMLQAVGLSEIAKGSHNIGLSVMVFTGYLLEELTENPLPGISDLLEATDILVDGPYIASQPETKRNWVGSANQRFYFLTDRYSPGIEYNPLYAHGFELRIYRDGTMRNNGWPNEFETTDDSRKQEDHF